jgi:hypothetical protein
VADAFDEIDYATVKKTSPEEEEARLKAELAGKPYRPSFRKRGATEHRAEKEPPVHHLGNPDDKFATTNHIESFFTQVRKDLARMSRRATTISKCVENLNRAFSLYVFHHNFVKRHYSLSNMTPAEASGIDDSKWEWDDFIDLLDDFWRARREYRKALKGAGQEAAEIQQDAQASEIDRHDGDGDGPFCVYHAVSAKYAKIHSANCVHLRSHPGRGERKWPAQKLRCESIEAARALAEQLAPLRVTECKICLGEYSSLKYLGPKRAWAAAGRTLN